MQNVLITDDSILYWISIKTLLKRFDVQIDDALGGKDCLATMSKTGYSIYFLDLLLPQVRVIEV